MELHNRTIESLKRVSSANLTAWQPGITQVLENFGYKFERGAGSANYYHLDERSKKFSFTSSQSGLVVDRKKLALQTLCAAAIIQEKETGEITPVALSPAELMEMPDDAKRDLLRKALGYLQKEKNGDLISRVIERDDMYVSKATVPFSGSAARNQVPNINGHTSPTGHTIWGPGEKMPKGTFGDGKSQIHTDTEENDDQDQNVGGVNSYSSSKIGSHVDRAYGGNEKPPESAKKDQKKNDKLVPFDPAKHGNLKKPDPEPETLAVQAQAETVLAETAAVDQASNEQSSGFNNEPSAVSDAQGAAAATEVTAPDAKAEVSNPPEADQTATPEAVTAAVAVSSAETEETTVPESEADAPQLAAADQPTGDATLEETANAPVAADTAAEQEAVRDTAEVPSAEMGETVPAAVSETVGTQADQQADAATQENSEGTTVTVQVAPSEAETPEQAEGTEAEKATDAVKLETPAETPESQPKFDEQAAAADQDQTISTENKLNAGETAMTETTELSHAEDIQTARRAFGEEVHRLKEENDWSLGDLAQNLNSALAETKIEVQTDQIKDWIFGRAYPAEGRVYEALERTLLEGLGYEGEELANVQARLKEAYERTKAAIDQHGPGATPDHLAFGDLLLELREEKQLGTNKLLAEALNADVAIQRDPSLPEAFDRATITQIVRGHYELSQPLVTLLSSALKDEQGALQAKYDAILTAEGKAVVTLEGEPDAVAAGPVDNQTTAPVVATAEPAATANVKSEATQDAVNIDEIGNKNVDASQASISAAREDNAMVASNTSSDHMARMRANRKPADHSSDPRVQIKNQYFPDQSLSDIAALISEKVGNTLSSTEQTLQTVIGAYNRTNPSFPRQPEKQTRYANALAELLPENQRTEFVSSLLKAVRGVGSVSKEAAA